MKYSEAKNHSLVVIAGTAVAFLLIGSLTGKSEFIARAGLKPTECYEVPNEGTPFGGKESLGSEIWCYRELENPQGSRLIYNVDKTGHMRTELSMIVEADGTMRHVSLKQGKLTPHRVLASDFNPVGAPLMPPPNAKRVKEPISPSASQSIESGIRTLNENWQNVPVRAAIVKEGVYTATSDVIPWRGYWYPYSSDRLHRGEDSPMAKYDRFVARRALKTNPGAVKWENYWHNGGYGWSGHCNGWAAAAVLAPEPKVAIRDPYSGEVFRPFDLKGLLIERHYCPKYVMYGSRNFGTGQNQADIIASTFHNVLTYFIGELRKPVLADLMSTRPVQNSVISGYSMDIRRTGTHSFFVDARVRVHLYDKDPSDQSGVARYVTKRYRYSLRVDDSGQVVSGSWSSANPDFLWIALAPSTCPDHNEVVDQFWIDEINRVGEKAKAAPTPTPAPDAPSGEDHHENEADPIPFPGDPSPTPSATPTPTPVPTESES